MGGLLYPGCLVDVIATFRLSSSQDKGQAISTTLLHNIQVLAVQEESIISKNEPGKTPSKGRSDSGGTLTVTLMVDGRQAEALQLAMDNGKVTLAMKNPLDLKTADAEAMVLSQGRLAKLGELMSSSVYASPVGGNPDSNGLEDPNGSYVRQDATDDQSAERLRRMFGGEQSGQKPQWEITVIRGKDVKEEIVDITAETPEQE
jgi:Flp pilus assembly protein CpaB